MGLLISRFFSINTCIVFIHSWEFADVEGQIYGLIYVLYIGDFDHLPILVSIGSPEINSPTDPETFLSMKG